MGNALGVFQSKGSECIFAKRMNKEKGKEMCKGVCCICCREQCVGRSDEQGAGGRRE